MEVKHGELQNLPLALECDFEGANWEKKKIKKTCIVCVLQNVVAFRPAGRLQPVRGPL
jgi:hypothetical protein